MATITVSDIKERARFKADMVGSNFISESGNDELLSYVNEAFFAYYDKIVSAFEDYFITGPSSFSISSGSNTYTLPSDFYKLAGVDRAMDGSSTEFYTLTPYAWRNRNRYDRTSYRMESHRKNVSYRIVGSTLYILPELSAPGNYRLWYVPLATALTSNASTVERFNGFEELIVVDTAIKMLTKEESDISALLLERQRIEKRMEDMLIERDIANADRIEEQDNYYNDEFEDSYYL